MKTMKILLIIGIVLGVLILLGWLFVRWANQPENVAALQEDRAKRAAEKEQQEKAVAEAESRRGSFTHLLVDERFTDNRFEKLAPAPSTSSFRFEEHQLKFNITLTQGSNAYEYFFLTPDMYGDFVAEIDQSIWGSDARIGIVWDAEPEPGKNPKNYQAAYCSPGQLFVITDGTERFSLYKGISSQNEQKLRVERIGPTLKVSVNGELKMEGTAPTGKGRVGIYLTHMAPDSPPESVSIAVKRFQLWGE
jgi:hypothetical protein